MVMWIAVLTLGLLLNRDVVAGALSDGVSPMSSKTARLVAPKSVEITKNGARSEYMSGNETADMCRSFVLPPADVREFFKRARRVTEREYGHDLVAANCYAEGKAHFPDGGTAAWQIDQARRGFVSMPDGNTLYLYCPKCRANVFAPN